MSPCAGGHRGMYADELRLGFHAEGEFSAETQVRTALLPLSGLRLVPGHLLLRGSGCFRQAYHRRGVCGAACAQGSGFASRNDPDMCYCVSPGCLLQHAHGANGLCAMRLIMLAVGKQVVNACNVFDEIKSYFCRW